MTTRIAISNESNNSGRLNTFFILRFEFLGISNKQPNS
jgi:hypothetical protein